MNNSMNKKSSLISIIGKPNAGKSTLLNHLIGQKISIVTHKVQTTRSMIKGILTSGNTQLVLVDTPGIFNPKKNLEKAMVRCAWSSIVGANLVLFIIDSRVMKSGIITDDEINLILKRLKENNIEPWIVINKMDLVNESYDFSVLSDYSKKIFYISALTGDKCQNLLDELIDHAPEGPWYYDGDDITTAPMRFLAAEITREQLFLNLHDELPYNLMVDTESWQELSDGSVKINQVIYVTRDSHKAMVLGKYGSMIKKIGQMTRENINEAFGLQVHLFLFVKVKEDWDSNPYLYKTMGLEFNRN